VRIAVIGGGISGLVCAYLLGASHEVHLFESEPRLGGHTHTHCVRHEGREWNVDTGFIVFNERNYPMFCRLLQRLGVASRSSTMTFSVRDEASGFEYGGGSLLGMLGAWSNAVRPRWWRVAQGVASLGRKGKALIESVDANTTLGDLADSGVFSHGFLHDYLLPMGGAIWSAPREAMLRFPAMLFLRFFDNHGMLDLRERPAWRTIVGGSRAYVDAIAASLSGMVHASRRVRGVRRDEFGVLVDDGSKVERFDSVVLGVHADQALAMLGDASQAEQEVLSAMPFQANEAVLHTDASLLPRRQRCWAAWNSRVSSEPSAPVSVTYNMSILQGLPTREPLCVTLNCAQDIRPDRILARMTYHHPLYTLAGQAARGRWSEISCGRTHYCGAYWGSGFHEDGVVSALRVCERLGVTL